MREKWKMFSHVLFQLFRFFWKMPLFRFAVRLSSPADSEWERKEKIKSTSSLISFRSVSPLVFIRIVIVLDLTFAIAKKCLHNKHDILIRVLFRSFHHSRQNTYFCHIFCSLFVFRFVCQAKIRLPRLPKMTVVYVRVAFSARWRNGKIIIQNLLFRCAFSLVHNIRKKREGKPFKIEYIFAPQNRKLTVQFFNGRQQHTIIISVGHLIHWMCDGLENVILKHFRVFFSFSFWELTFRRNILANDTKCYFNWKSTNGKLSWGWTYLVCATVFVRSKLYV